MRRILGILVAILAPILGCSGPAVGMTSSDKGRNTEESVKRGDDKYDMWLKTLEGEIKRYTEIIRLQPNSLDAYHRRGTIKYIMGDIEGAIKDYDEVVRINPDHPEPYCIRGITKRDKGDLEGAIKDLDECIRLRPIDRYAFLNRGIAKAAKGDLEGAIRDYDEAIRLHLKYLNQLKDHGIAVQANDEEERPNQKSSELDRPEMMGFARGYAARGMAKALVGDRESGKADLEKVIDFVKFTKAERQYARCVIWFVEFGGDRGRLEKYAEGTDWISHVVRFYLGRTTSEQLLVEARKAGMIHREQELTCEAYTYMGLLAERKGDMKAARASYEACVATGIIKNDEYIWSKVRFAALSNINDKK